MGPHSYAYGLVERFHRQLENSQNSAHYNLHDGKNNLLLIFIIESLTFGGSEIVGYFFNF